MKINSVIKKYFNTTNEFCTIFSKLKKKVSGYISYFLVAQLLVQSVTATRSSVVFTIKRKTATTIVFLSIRKVSGICFSRSVYTIQNGIGIMH